MEEQISSCPNPRMPRHFVASSPSGDPRWRPAFDQPVPTTFAHLTALSVEQRAPRITYIEPNRLLGEMLERLNEILAAHIHSLRIMALALTGDAVGAEALIRQVREHSYR